jgi:NAD-dependent deacetylase
MSSLDPDVLQDLARELAGSQSVLVITGAGLSADSGLPTYRGVGGLYNDLPTPDGVAIEEALSGEMLQSNPQLCWRYLQQIEQATRRARPNAGHQALAELHPRFERFTVLTQNVDGFHRQVGQPDLIEIHGNLHELHCVGCAYERWVEDYQRLNIPPQCPDCGAAVRPRVVLFGEMLPEAALERLHAVLYGGVDFVLSVGTSAVFPYIAAPVVAAVRAGLPTAEINPGVSEISSLVRYRLQSGAAEGLVALTQRLAGRRH